MPYLVFRYCLSTKYSYNEGMTIEREKQFWSLVRRALLMIVRAIEERYDISSTGAG
jgi:hypothetical protein